MQIKALICSDSVYVSFTCVMVIIVTYLNDQKRKRSDMHILFEL